jgi:hypothetical protein
VYIVVRDSNGQLAADGPTGEAGIAIFDLVGYVQAANGTKDISMNPYTIDSSWDGATGVQEMTDMSNGHMQVTVVKYIPDQTLTIALVTIAVAALLLGIALFLVSRRD